MVFAAAATDASSGDVDEDHPRAQSPGGPVTAFGVPAADVDGVARGDELAGGLEAESLYSLR